MLKVNKLTKHFQNGEKITEVIKEVSFNIKNGDFVSFVGPSGCGKTTLLKIIAGLLEKEKGEIFVDDKKVTKVSKNIGMVFQDFSLFPWLNVRENIAFGLRLKNISQKKIDETVNHYLKITGLNDFADVFPNSLSGGMKQRVAIARTLANEPQLILMDEPFGSLDNLTRQSMQEFLTTLWEKEKKTIVFITHDIEEAIFLSNKVYLLSNRPTVIKKEFNVNFKRPRKHSLKKTKEFFDLRNKLSDEFM
tara:strand:- start:79 stop:822 length:744 start_codon:yes stop_codon:yes gene_type:complete